MDNPEKAQYEPSDVRCIASDYIGTIGLAIDKYVAIGEMQDFCEQYNVVSFYALAKYARGHRQDWHRILCDCGSVFMREYLQSRKWSKEQNFGDIEISQVNRQKAYDAIAKPVYKDPETGEYLTAIQKYEREHRHEFLKNLGLLFTLTDNFTNLNNLIKGKVNKESRKAIKELENTLNNTHRTSDGNLNFMSGVSEDPESIFKGYNLDI